MPTTVPIPAEIVGDTKTLVERRDVIDEEILSTAICIGRYADTFTGPLHIADCVDRVARRDAIADEVSRRYTARGLAR